MCLVDIFSVFRNWLNGTRCIGIGIRWSVNTINGRKVGEIEMICLHGYNAFGVTMGNVC